MTTDPIMSEIMAAIAVLHGGDRLAGRAALDAVWSRIATDPEPFHECVLSHYMADAQDDLAAELYWDLRALDAALRCTDADIQRPLSIPTLMPSLHANLAEDYLKLGDFPRGREHLRAARTFVGHLAEDAYGRMIRRGIARLEKKCEAASNAS